MTIKELILENDNFAHSEEAFEIYKESAELNVLNAWIECQEHKAFTNCDMFTEADDNALSAAKEKAEAKEEALHKKIWDKIKTIAKRVWDAILKLIDKILRTFGVMRMPALSDEQKNALLNGKYVFDVGGTILGIMNIYRKIPFITDDSFTNLGDRGTRKLAEHLVGNNSTKLSMMAATQIAIWLTGSSDLILPPIIFGGNSVIDAVVKRVKKELYFKKLIKDFEKETSANKVVSDYAAFERVSHKDFDAVEKTIRDLRKEIDDIEFESTDNMNNQGIHIINKILNRDLKICTAAFMIQLEYKDVKLMIEKDLKLRNRDKNK